MKTFARRLAALLLAFAFIIWDMPQIDLRSSAANLPGSGTAEDPYRISTIGQFKELRIDHKSHYRLMNDLDFSNTMVEYNYTFSGTLDGNGYTITPSQAGTAR